MLARHFKAKLLILDGDNITPTVGSNLGKTEAAGSDCFSFLYEDFKRPFKKGSFSFFCFVLFCFVFLYQFCLLKTLVLTFRFNIGDRVKYVGPSQQVLNALLLEFSVGADSKRSEKKVERGPSIGYTGSIHNLFQQSCCVITFLFVFIYLCYELTIVTVCLNLMQRGHIAF